MRSAIGSGFKNGSPPELHDRLGCLRSGVSGGHSSLLSAFFHGSELFCPPLRGKFHGLELLLQQYFQCGTLAGLHRAFHAHHHDG
jgi:hypothetical protein